jgi:YHS domain-containing protein
VFFVSRDEPRLADGLLTGSSDGAFARKVFRMSTRLLGLAVLAAFVAGFAVNAADEKEKKFDAKCIVAGKPAKQEQSADYKGGKVYFCCGNCKANFEKNQAKFATKANEQLVATGQAKQVKCPISGQPCKEDKVTEVDGVKVYFCCDNCKGKVAKAKGDEQIALCFSDDAFKKAFEVEKKKEK